MRALVGAIVGLVVGVAIVTAFGASGVQEYWPILVVGVVAGAIMKGMAGGPTPSYLRGGLAACVTVAALFGGLFTAAKVIQSRGVTISSPSVQKAPADNKAPDAPIASAEVAAPEPVALTETSLPPASIAKGRQSDVQPLDIAFLVIGCLVAYQMGKGATGVAAPADSEGEEAAEGAPETEGAPASADGETPPEGE